MGDNHRMMYAPPRDPTNVMGRRIVAYLIDTVIVVAIALAIFAATTKNTFTDAPPNACQILQDRGDTNACFQTGSTVYTWEDSSLALGWGMAALASIANYVILQSITGASIGKLIMGLRVVDEDGDVAGWGRMAVRWIFLPLVDALCFLIGLLTASLTHPHRRVGDFVAGTYVIGSADAGRPIRQTFTPAYQQAGGAPTWMPPVTPQPAPTQWGTPPPPEQPGWGAPPPAAQPGWGTAPPPPPPAPPQPQWGSPPPPPQPHWETTPPPAEQWNAPPPPPSAYEPPPAYAPSPAPQQPGPASTEQPQEEAPPPASEPLAPFTPKPKESPGESWWDKALGDNDGDDENPPSQ